MRRRTFKEGDYLAVPPPDYRYKCSKCGVEKPRIGFSTDRSKGRGHTSQCLECRRENTRKFKDTLEYVVVSHKECTKCGLNKAAEDFHRTPYSKDGRHTVCAACSAQLTADWADRNKARKHKTNLAYVASNREKLRAKWRKWGRENRPYVAKSQARRRATKKCATPAWANEHLIQIMYDEAAYSGRHVDHIVPLKSDLVCGLHWEGNLQILSAEENLRKGNRWWEDMP